MWAFQWVKICPTHYMFPKEFWFTISHHYWHVCRCSCHCMSLLDLLYFSPFTSKFQETLKSEPHKWTASMEQPSVWLRDSERRLSPHGLSLSAVSVVILSGDIVGRQCRAVCRRCRNVTDDVGSTKRLLQLRRLLRRFCFAKVRRI